MKINTVVTSEWLRRLKEDDLWKVYKLLQLVSGGFEQPSQQELETVFLQCEKIVIEGL